MSTIKSRIENLKDKFTPVHAVVITISTILAVSGVAIYQYRRAENYQLRLENQYLRAVSDLSSFVENIENNLTKGIVVTDAKEMVKIANQVYSQAAFARSTLGQLPSYDGALSGTSKFLSQVGDYTYNLSMRYLDGGEITPDEYNTLEKLIGYAASLHTSLLSLQEQLYSNSVTLSDMQDMSKESFEAENAQFASSVKETESHFEDFPSLIYDGPYSDHLKDHKPALLQGKENITKETAEIKVKNLFGQKFNGEISYTGENGGTLPTYNFSVKQSKNDDRNITVEITKQGGAISWFLDSRSVGEATLSMDDARKNANSFLSRYNFGDPRETYYETTGGMAVINFACTQGDVICYPDLIKVKVALDNGEILGLECSGYISNHKERSLPHFKYTEEEVAAKVSPKATVTKVAKALIPTEAGGEIFCYEVLCSYKDKTFLVYLNAETLRQEDVLMLLISESGSLTM